MAATRNQPHTGSTDAGATTGLRTPRSRIGELWVTILAALPGTARIRQPRGESRPAPVPDASLPQPEEPVPSDDQNGWPTWRNPR